MLTRKLDGDLRWSTYVIKGEIVLMLAFVLWNKSTESNDFNSGKDEKYFIKKFLQLINLASKKVDSHMS